MKWGFLALALILGFIGGLGAFLAAPALFPPAQSDLISEFYAIENAVHVSPHSLRKMMDKGDGSYVLVDLRSAEEYDKEHIIGAVSIPAYKDKVIIVYCYSTPCMTGRKVGKMLADKGIFVKHLGIGWNDWRYDWTAWNHVHEWNITSAENYTWAGSEPGKPTVIDGKPPGTCDQGQFGC